MQSAISADSSSVHASIDALVEEFSEQLGAERASLMQYWDRLKTSQSLTLLSSLIKVELQQRFRRGERPTAGDYFVLFPQIAADRDRVLSLVYEEFCLLEDVEGNPSVSEFCKRYQPWQDSLVSQLGYHREFSQIVGTKRPDVIFPKAGQRFATFQLDEVIGQGGAAQVYRATDDLGGRKVVLKVTPSIGREPIILARLDHRNIVPILSLAEAPESGLHGICMPYRPGLTLQTLQTKLGQGNLPKRAKTVYDLIEIPQPGQVQENPGWLNFPIQGTYSEAIAWLGLAMAHALAYLHQENVYHRDIKPANIWLSHRDGPLLFDFNLAHQPSDPEQAKAAATGGTLPYMAPEQLKAFLDPQYWDSVKAGADIYALGLVLRELVTGITPDVPRPNLPLNRAIQDLYDRRHDMQVSCRHHSPSVPPSLDAILLKCLAFEPELRYQNAADLATDLQKFLLREPLVYAANSSRLERTVNWGYRRHRWLGLVATLFLCGLLLVGQQARPLAETTLQQGIRLLESDKHEDWLRAREIFAQSARQNTRSAEPLLYLGHACLRLKQVKEGKTYLSQAYGMPDLEAAIERGLHLDPQWIPLKISLCDYYLSVKHDPIAALRVATQTSESHPNHFGSWKLLANVQYALKQYLQSLESYEEAVRLAEVQHARTDAFMIRKELIRVSLVHLNHLLAQNAELTTRQEARALLERVGNHFKILMASLAASKNDPLGEAELLCMQGTWKSESAYLKILDAHQAQAIEDFYAAHHAFDQADAIARKLQPASAEWLKSLVDSQRKYLAQRLKSCHLENLLERPARQETRVEGVAHDG